MDKKKVYLTQLFVAQPYFSKWLEVSFRAGRWVPLRATFSPKVRVRSGTRRLASWAPDGYPAGLALSLCRAERRQGLRLKVPSRKKYLIMLIFLSGQTFNSLSGDESYMITFCIFICTYNYLPYKGFNMYLWS